MAILEHMISAKKYITGLRAIALIMLLAATLPIASGCGSAEPASSSPSSSPAKGTPDGAASFRFIVCGDPQNNYEVFDRVLAAAKSVDFLIIAGDLTGSGTPAEFETFKRAMAASGVKYYCVPGNHDVATSPVGQGYAQYIGPPHSSFDYKNTHFLLIDNSTPGLGFYPAERQWAAADLARAKSKGFEHMVAVTHVAPGWPYSAKASSEQIVGIDANHELVPVLKAGGVKDLFCGHVHGYEQETDSGVRITITGGAGAPLMGMSSFHNYVLVTVTGRRIEQNVVRI
jgi:Icc-related predicted phosphoesterase